MIVGVAAMLQAGMILRQLRNSCTPPIISLPVHTPCDSLVRGRSDDASGCPAIRARAISAAGVQLEEIST